MAGCAGDSDGPSHMRIVLLDWSRPWGGWVVGTSSGSPGLAPTAPRELPSTASEARLRLPQRDLLAQESGQMLNWPDSLVSVGIPVVSDEVVVVAVTEQGWSRGFRPPLLADVQQTRERDGRPGSGHRLASWANLALQPPHASCGLGQGVDGEATEPDPGEPHLLPTPKPRGLVAVPLQARGGGLLLKHSPWGDSP